MSSGGDQPAAKRHKAYNADGPIEDDRTAREKLREAGFDPEDVHTGLSEMEDGVKNDHDLTMWVNITPMAYFASRGDLPMCRYLHHVRGAATTKVAEADRSEPNSDVMWFPLYIAAYDAQREYFEVIKWLYRHGAKGDMLTGSFESTTPLSTCFYSWDRPRCTEDSIPEEMVAFVHWLVVNGELEREQERTTPGTVCRFLYELQRENDWMVVGVAKELFTKWLRDLLQPNDAFHMFLLGTLPAPQYSGVALKRLCADRLGSVGAAAMLVDRAVSNGEGRIVWDKLMEDTGRPTNACLASLDGVLEKIGDYVGIIRCKTRVRRVRDALDIASKITKEELEEYTDSLMADELSMNVGNA